MQVLFLEKKLGTQFSGDDSGLTDWGIYVELDNNKCEGMIPLNSIKDDQYIMTMNKLTCNWTQHKKSYKLGQEINVIVKKADITKKTN